MAAVTRGEKGVRCLDAFGQALSTDRRTVPSRLCNPPPSPTPTPQPPAWLGTLFDHLPTPSLSALCPHLADQRSTRERNVRLSTSGLSLSLSFSSGQCGNLLGWKLLRNKISLCAPPQLHGKRGRKRAPCNSNNFTHTIDYLSDCQSLSDRFSSCAVIL